MGRRDTAADAETDSASSRGSPSDERSNSEGNEQEDIINDNEDPPKPVSSDEEEDEDGDAFNDEVGPSSSNTKSASQETTEKRTLAALVRRRRPQGSRFFAPYRTLGIVSNGRPFALVPHDHSGNVIVALPIGNRFHFVRTDHLRPVLVSQQVPGSTPQEISHVVTDPTVNITVTAHGNKPPQQSSVFLSSYVTLYLLTQPVHTKRLVPPEQNGDWCIQDLLHLGRVKVPLASGEKEGQLENSAIVAAILRKLPPANENDDNVPLVGDDKDDDDSTNSSSSDDESSSSSDSDDQDAEKWKECACQVVIMLASRRRLTVQKRLHFCDLNLPHFAPMAVVHPPTYLNKIVLAGYNESSATRRPAMVLLNIRSGKVIHQFQCLDKASRKGESLTTLTPSPAVDTIAVGTSHGKVHLVNLRHDQKLFSLAHYGGSGSNKPVGITSISFRTDVAAMNYATAPMAVGRDDGTITVWDLQPPSSEDASPAQQQRTILTELKYVHAPGGIAKLQFLPQEPLLVSIGTRSNSLLLHVFDNPDHSGRVLKQRQGHTAPPQRIQYLFQGQILANAVDGTDAATCQILSTGSLDCTLRVFSTAHTASDKEYGQGRGLAKKAKLWGLNPAQAATEVRLPPVTALATCEARSRDWGDLVTIHQDHAMAYVWSSHRGAQSGPVLRQDAWNVSAMKRPPPTHAHATAVTLSACGNFAMIGTRGGCIYKYNVQSGLTRGSYPKNFKPDDEDYDEANKKKDDGPIPGSVSNAIKEMQKLEERSRRLANVDQMEQNAEQQDLARKALERKLQVASHVGHTVTGLAVDALNKTLYSVGADGKLILWNLVTHSPHVKSPRRLPEPATQLHLVRDSGLAAVALQDFSVLLLDLSTQAIVRRFGGNSSPHRHGAPITDMGFSPDGRSLYTASMDSTLRVWDVPTDRCVDWLSFATPPTALTLSPTGEFLATTHVGNLGIHIWTDKSFYQTVYTGDGAAAALTHPFAMHEPSPLAETAADMEHETRQEEKSNQQPQDQLSDRGDNTESSANSPSSPENSVVIPKEKGLVTMSGLAPSHWKNLFHLELVKERNKPKEAPKKPPSAPFFLQWRSGEEMENKDPAVDEATSEEEKEEWAAAWSDDDGDDNEGGAARKGGKKRGIAESKKTPTEDPLQQKRRKITHSRSHLATLLQKSQRSAAQQHSDGGEEDSSRYAAVTEHVATLGPSAIDIALSTLCSGPHDLEQGLPLLCMAAEWLLEELESRHRFETTNAYLHRFLFLHANVIGGIEDDDVDTAQQHDEGDGMEERNLKLAKERLSALLQELRRAQQTASAALRNKMQRAACLLRHFTRMV